MNKIWTITLRSSDLKITSLFNVFIVFAPVSACSYSISPLLEQGKKGITGSTGEVGNALVSAPPKSTRYFEIYYRSYTDLGYD